MSHARVQIRAAVAARLLNLATTGTRVYPGRRRALDSGDAPSLLIYTPRETAARSSHQRSLDRTLTLVVVGRVVSASLTDDDLDQIAEEVETALATDITLGNLVLNLRLQPTELVAEAKGDAEIGRIALEYQVTYRTREGAPGVLL